MPAAPRELVPLAVVTAAHGVMGELRVKLHNPGSPLLASRRGQGLAIRSAGAMRVAALREIRPGPAGSLLVTLEGCADREAAQALRGAELCVRRDELPALGAGEYYLCDLVGLEVRDASDAAVGRVAAVLEYPAAQVLQVTTRDGLLEVPLVPPYLRELRLDAGLAIVDQLEDLERLPPPKRRRR